MAGSVVIIGGTAGLGLELARHYTGLGRDVVLTGRDAGRASAVAGSLGGTARGLAVELSEPGGIAAALRDVDAVDRLVLAAIDRDANTVAGYDIEAAVHLATLKLVGYTAVVHQMTPRLTEGASVLIFGGMARLRPYPGSTTVSTVNAGVIGLVRTLSVELAPVRVNSIHPGIVADSPFWIDKPAPVLEVFRSGTLTGRLASMRDVVDASVFLLENPSVNGVDLSVDGGWR